MNRQSAGKTLEILSKYQELNSIIEVAKYFNVSYETIRKILRKNEVVSNKKKPVYGNSLKVDYFKNIDSEDKAYFLGFIKADGYIDHTRNRFALRVSERDLEILQRFCDALNLPQQRINKIVKNKNSEYYSTNRQDCVELAITHREFISYFKDVKENTILEKIPENMAYHFIRGYFDGDGCINYKEVKKLHFQCNIMGSPNDDHMLQYIKKYFDFRQYTDKRSNLPFLKTEKSSVILEMADKCYSNCYIYLTRKKVKFDLFRFTKETSTTTCGISVSSSDKDIV